MKRFNFGRLTAIALALSVVACERSPQAEQRPLDSEQSSEPSVVVAADDPSLSSEAKRLETEPRSRDAASSDFALSFPSAPQQSTRSLGLATRYGKAGLPNARPPRVVTAGRPNPFHAVHQPRVEVTYEQVAQSTQKPLEQGSAEEVAPFPAVPPLQAASQQVLTVPQAVPAVAFGEPAPAVPSVVQPLPQPVALAPVPPTVLPVPAVPPLTVPASIPAFAPDVISSVSPVSQTAIAEAIEIKGLIQVGEKFNLIIKDPTADTSRTVQVGDVIGGGRVTINRIDALDSQEPQVVLEQDGVEVVRSIGV